MTRGMPLDDARTGVSALVTRTIDAEGKPTRHELTTAQTAVLDALVRSWNKERAAYGGRRAVTRDYVIAALLDMAPLGELK